MNKLDKEQPCTIISYVMEIPLNVNKVYVHNCKLNIVSIAIHGPFIIILRLLQSLF